MLPIALIIISIGKDITKDESKYFFMVINKA